MSPLQMWAEKACDGLYDALKEGKLGSLHLASHETLENLCADLGVVARGGTPSMQHQHLYEVPEDMSDYYEW